ncbi:MAG: 1-(5-phosphoribosyl)-5-[(5-phosphoribosylamino)methylideneamino]imidazole-4-carboxamide isomerase [Fimbriimonadaceae bacterium]|nr:1-(5-phosphoribosyl)-5-[(5-phosphoribosylamino)methylideneamino]imidazole-4-carboxamide isomerase [Fimbriimonadaceae bacterium]
MVIFPAIDVRGGRCVRLTQGDYGRETIYAEDPVEQAHRFVDEGARWLHIVDLDGAREGRPVNVEPIRRIVREGGVPVQVGGGIRTLESADEWLAEGVSRVIVGTVLARDAGLAARFFERYGERVVAGIDARQGLVAVAGWREGTSEDTVTFARRMVSLGARRAIFTEIAVDGSLDGVAIEATRGLAEALRIPVIASGGVGSLADVVAVRELASVGVEGLIVGKALYEGRFRLADAIAATR